RRGGGHRTAARRAHHSARYRLDSGHTERLVRAARLQRSCRAAGARPVPVRLDQPDLRARGERAGALARGRRVLRTLDRSDRAGRTDEHRVEHAGGASRGAAAAQGGARRESGAVPGPPNTLLTPRDYEYILNDSRAAVAIAAEELAPAIEAIRPRLRFLHELIVTGRPGPGQVGLAELVGAESEELDAATTTKDDVAFWLYPSGK